MTVKYLAPLRSTDMYMVTVGIREYTRTRVVCAQRVIQLDPEFEESDRVRDLFTEM
jgi:acyl-CoA thioesterase FadM